MVDAGGGGECAWWWGSLTRPLRGWVLVEDGKGAAADGGGEGSGLRLSTAFVGSATFFNLVAFFLALYFWTVNRQTHFRKTRGSVVAHKVETSVDGEADGGDSSDDDEDYVDDRMMEEEEEDDEAENKVGFEEQIPAGQVRDGRMSRAGMKRSNTWRRLMSDISRERTWKSILSYEVEPDHDVEEEEAKIPSPATTTELPVPPAPGTGDRPSMRSLADAASKIKIFSYLGVEAMKVCLGGAEYVDVPLGDALFERGAFDGSLFVVVSGAVECRFHDYATDDDSDGDNNELLSFTSEPGSVVTPLLALLAALVQDQRRKNGDGDEGPSRLFPMAQGVSAVATKEDTRLIRVPPDCFSAVLDKFPENVYRIAQTIVCRVQRVTLHTLVRTLGLQKDLLRQGADWETPGAWAKRMASPEWYRLASSLAEGGDKSMPGSKMSSIISDAAAVAAAELGIPEGVPVLRDNSTIITLPAGKTLIKTGFPHDALYLLLTGEMEVGVEIPGGAAVAGSRSSSSRYKFHHHCKVVPGSLVGRLACFSGDVSVFTVRTLPDGEGCTLLKIPKSVFDTLVVQHQRLLVSCLDFILGMLSPLVHLVNFNSEWMHVQASEVIAHRGDPCESMFIVLNGRVRGSYISAMGKSVEEYGRGKCIGDIGGITKSKWPCKVYAIRNSELARVPVKVLVAIIRSNPRAGLHFARVIASQVQSKFEGRPGGFPSLGGQKTVPRKRSMKVSERPSAPKIMPSYGLTLATIAIVPLTSEVDVSEFCTKIVSSLGIIAPSKLMTKEIARQHLGEKVYNHQNPMHELKMTRLLGDMEEKHRLVVYQSDLTYTWWTRLCISQADAILLLVKADESPLRKRVEQCLSWAYESMHVRIELVVVEASKSADNNEGDETKIGASNQLDNWSEQREWITGSHLVRFPFEQHEPDFRRLCRRITGLSIGLVLGGGGARGLAHLGVIRALMEAGVTVDMVGGTSQGAFVAALYAKSPDSLDTLMNRSRQMATSMSSIMEKLLDLTLPLTSMFSGRRFNKSIQDCVGHSTRIQDLVLSFFCVSTDIQKREMIVHTKGCLWKYVRASMSLSGYLPPISEKGSLLVDGGYLNVVPSDVMREQFGARTVIAVDVAAENERDYYEYGTHLNGWWLLWNSWNPFVETVKVPSMGDISDSLRWVSSDQHRRRMADAADLHLTPPIKEYGTLEYDKFDEIVEKGYLHAKPIIDDWVKRNPLLVSDQGTNEISSRAFSKAVGRSHHPKEKVLE